MKKIVMVSILALTAALISANQASAGIVKERMHNQALRIQHGIAIGELTRHETRILKQEQRRIRRLRKIAWTDGRFSPRERRRIEKLQNRASNHIYRLKHNSKRRHYYYR